jgi:hypothetical protein
MQKRGQSSQVFIYILTIVIVALVLFFGYKYVMNIKGTIGKAELTLFQDKLTSDIATISSDFGSVRKVSYSTQKIEELCLLDLTKREQISGVGHPLIKDSIKSGVNRNGFILGGSTFESFFIGNSEVEFPYFVCFKKQQGKIEFTIEGKGDRALILTHTEKTPLNIDGDIDEINAIEDDLDFDLEGLDSILEDIESI